MDEKNDDITSQIILCAMETNGSRPFGLDISHTEWIEMVDEVRRLRIEVEMLKKGAVPHQSLAETMERFEKENTMLKVKTSFDYFQPRCPTDHCILDRGWCGRCRSCPGDNHYARECDECLDMMIREVEEK